MTEVGLTWQAGHQNTFWSDLRLRFKLLIKIQGAKNLFYYGGHARECSQQEAFACAQRGGDLSFFAINVQNEHEEVKSRLSAVEKEKNRISQDMNEENHQLRNQLQMVSYTSAVAAAATN